MQHNTFQNAVTFIFLLLGLFQSLAAQETKILDFSFEKGKIYAFSLEKSQNTTFVALSFSFEKSVDMEALQLRFRSEKEWSPWQTISQTPHQGGDRLLFGQVFVPAPNREFEISIAGAEKSIKGKAFLFFPPQKAYNLAQMPTRRGLLPNDTCDCPQPTFVPRSVWGGPPNQQNGCTPNYTTVSHLIVHHEASTPVPPYPAAVLSIWQFHTQQQGWCDIAYNWLIDPDGNLYEGRSGGDDVVGAHFCGKNNGTMGVCLLGNFQTDVPTDTALATLEKLLAWKSCSANLEPDSTTKHTASSLDLPVISGHRLGCATLCPGENLFNKLPTVRDRVAYLHHDPTGCDGIYPPLNDGCADAISLQSSTTCTMTQADVYGATESGLPIPTCTGFTSSTAADVWFKFRATSAVQKVFVQPNSNNSDGIDPVVVLYEGGCASPQFVACSDTPGGSGGTGDLLVSNLTIGEEYLLRVFDFGSAPPEDPAFSICVFEQATSSTEFAPLEGVGIFPNPFSDNFMVEFSNTRPIELSVFNAQGQQVFFAKKLESKNVEIAASDWAEGLYFVTMLWENGQRSVKKLLKKP